MMLSKKKEVVVALAFALAVLIVAVLPHKALAEIKHGLDPKWAAVMAALALASAVLLVLGATAIREGGEKCTKR